MFQYSFTPLHQQFDDGFGAVGESFKTAADKLWPDSEKDVAFLHGHLPVSFLYRHAVELFLKGIIITLHRRLRSPSGAEPFNPDPLIPVAGESKPQPIYRVHGIADLYGCYRQIVSDHSDELRRIARTDWTAIPTELDEWIAAIDAADRTSTFFRYPVTRDRDADVTKSSVQEVCPEEVLAEVRAGGKPAKILMLVDDGDENIVGMYGLTGSESMSKIIATLKEAAEMLSGAHFGMMAELVYGYGKSGD